MTRVVHFLLFAVGWVSCLQEDTVDRILDSISEEAVKIQTPVRDYNYKFTKNIGPMKTELTSQLLSGNLIIEKIKRNGDVDYKAGSETDSATFSFTADLNVFVAYRYKLSASSSPLSSGTVAGTWLSPLQMTMEVDPQTCLVKFGSTNRRTTTKFDLDVKPSDNFIFPLTLHLLPGSGIELHLQADLNRVLSKVFTDKKLCDYYSC